MNFPAVLLECWRGKPYDSFNHVLKDTFAARVYKLGLRMNFRCPNRAGLNERDTWQGRLFRAPRVPK